MNQNYKREAEKLKKTRGKSLKKMEEELRRKREAVQIENDSKELKT